MLRNCQVLVALLTVVSGVRRFRETKTTGEWNVLSQWLTTNLGSVHEEVSSQQTRHGGFSIRGLTTHTFLWTNSQVLVVPRKLWVELSNFPDVKEVPLAHLAHCNHLSEKDLNRLRFAAAISLEERKGEASLHHVYFQGLPTLNDYHSFHPTLMESALKTDFAALPTVQLTQEMQKQDMSLQECFVDWKHSPQSLVSEVEWNEIQLALCHFRARGFAQEDTPVLIPGIDFINTETPNKLNSRVNLYSDSATLAVDSSLGVKSGEELLFGYCPDCDNSKLLLQWGVYLENNPNRLDANAVDCSADTAQGEGKTAKSLKDVTEEMLDYSGFSEESGQGAPRCLSAALSSDKEGQGPLRCSLARLAWEHCGHSWALSAEGQDNKIILSVPRKTFHVSNVTQVVAQINRKFIPSSPKTSTAFNGTSGTGQRPTLRQ